MVDVFLDFQGSQRRVWVPIHYFRRMMNQAARGFRFVLLELSGDRVSIQLQCDWRIKPIETVPVSEIEKA